MIKATKHSRAPRPRSQVCRKGFTWHLDGLKLANDLRAADPSIAKVRIVEAIVAQVPGAPNMASSITRWLTEREETGELRKKSRP